MSQYTVGLGILIILIGSWFLISFNDLFAVKNNLVQNVLKNIFTNDIGIIFFIMIMFAIGIGIIAKTIRLRI